MAQLKIQLIRGDITSANVDCIVNAANESLVCGGGVDRAIHNAAGPELAKSLRRFSGCPTGEAVLTPGFNLQAKHIIHAVGPIWNNFENPMKLNSLLKKTYASIFAIAVANGFSSIAIPNISTGVYDFPKRKAAPIAIEVTKDFLKQSHQSMSVHFYCFDQENYQIYLKYLKPFI